jgi:hypothetical protein
LKDDEYRPRSDPKGRKGPKARKPTNEKYAKLTKDNSKSAYHSESTDDIVVQT